MYKVGFVQSLLRVQIFSRIFVHKYVCICMLRIIVLDCYPKPDALNPCEDVMGAQWLRISVWVVVTLAVVGNVAVLVVTFSYWCVRMEVVRF